VPNAPAPIIIVKKKGHHGGHHGGAWKVAYADFVTAMMALFIVLWLMSSSAKVKEGVSGYFRDPMGVGKRAGTKLAGVGEAVPIKKDDMPKLKEKLEAVMRKLQDFPKLREQVKMTITPDGLRIELIETQGGFFFENGSSELTDRGKELLAALAKEIGALPNHLLIEGHTNSVPYTKNAKYTNWELSTDRANSARRLMSDLGLRDDQTTYVRGFADRQLRDPEHPMDAANRRVSLVIQYQETPGAAADDAEPDGLKEAKPPHGK
jgi:chemotaxis protein MotB